MPETSESKPHEKVWSTREYLLKQIGCIAVALLAPIALFLWFLFSPRPYPHDVNRRRMQCAITNLRQIGLAAKQYALDNGEGYPPDFTALLPDNIDTPKLFSCPSDPSAWEEVRTTGKVGRANTSYVYVSGLTISDDPRCILAFDRPENHRGDGANAVFLDTHVEWMLPDQFEKSLEETRALARGNGHEVRLLYE